MIGSKAAGFVHWTRIAALEQDILFGAHDEKCGAMREVSLAGDERTLTGAPAAFVSIAAPPGAPRDRSGTVACDSLGILSARVTRPAADTRSAASAAPAGSTLAAELRSRPVAVRIDNCCDPGLKGNAPGAADWFELMLLNDPEQPGLQFNRQFGNFIQKQTALSRAAEQAHLVGNRPSEGSTNMSKEFTFNQGGCQSRTIHGDKRLFAPGPEHVDRPCRKLFACARFSQDQHRGAGCSCRPYQFEHPQHLGSLPNKGTRRQIGAISQGQNLFRHTFRRLRL